MTCNIKIIVRAEKLCGKLLHRPLLPHALWELLPKRSLNGYFGGFKMM